LERSKLQVLTSTLIGVPRSRRRVGRVGSQIRRARDQKSHVARAETFSIHHHELALPPRNNCTGAPQDSIARGPIAHKGEAHASGDLSGGLRGPPRLVGTVSPIGETSHDRSLLQKDRFRVLELRTDRCDPIWFEH
jgi:hypothetical protein